MKLINWILMLGMLGGDVYYLINVFTTGDTSRLSTYLITIPIVLAPILFKKVLKFSDNLNLVYLLFIFLAQFLGSVVNLYSQISWFDTFTHFLSGILSCFVALIIAVKLHQKPTEKIPFFVFYIFGIVFLIACLWEFFEFGMDTFTGSNLQHAIETGVRDTMEDVLAAFGGSILFMLFYLAEMSKRKGGFITGFIKSLE